MIKIDFSEFKRPVFKLKALTKASETEPTPKLIMVKF